jgi:hypothetical protein
MFTPSQHDVRRFFCETYRKHNARDILSPLEAIAAGWVIRHPEYFEDFGDAERALTLEYGKEGAQTNPFLHLAMHLTIAEQVQVDQPPGIRAVFLTLAERHDEHYAHHEIMECLGQMIWTSQRDGLPPDGAQYLDCLRRRLA